MSVSLTVSEIEYQHHAKSYLSGVTFSVPAGKLYGLVGQNGSGKSTLLNIIAGALQADGGEIIIPNNTRVGYLAQNPEINPSFTIEQALLAAFLTPPDRVTQWHIWEEMQQLAVDYELPSLSTLVSELSGGQQRRVDLVATLITKPEIVLLDEPTNHLDIQTIGKLEKILKESDATGIVISHDRAFLDNVCDGIVELWNGRVYVHIGNYSQYLENRNKRLENESVDDERRRQFLKREIEWVRAGVQARGTKDKGRLDRFYEVKEQVSSAQLEVAQVLIPEALHIGNNILAFNELELTDPQKNILLRNFSLRLEKGMKIGVIGRNGSGKTSLLKAILQAAFIDRPESIFTLSHFISQTESKVAVKGSVRIGLNTRFNLIDQKREQLDGDSTVFRFIANEQEKMPFGEGEVSSRRYLQSFLFDNEKIQSHIRDLSGGEKARVLLAKEFCRGGNVLLLDEPTNDLDLDTIRSLETAIEHFAGCAFIISHDRTFLNNTCNYILSFDGEGKHTLSTGNYDRWFEEFGRKNSLSTTNIQIDTQKYKPEKPNYHQLKDAKKQLRKLEADIEKYTLELEKLEKITSDPHFYETAGAEKAAQTYQKISNIQQTLSEFETQWLELSELV